MKYDTIIIGAGFAYGMKDISANMAEEILNSRGVKTKTGVGVKAVSYTHLTLPTN